MKSISTPLAVSLAIVVGIIGFSAGYATTPEYRQSMYSKTSMDLGRADATLDLRYVNAMIAHHRGAMLVAEQISGVTQRPELQGLAAEILKNEPGLIAELYAWKKEWYNDTRAVRDPVVPKLGAYDESYDLRLLNALIAHHEAGLDMTKEIKTKSSRTEVLNNADAVDTFLKTTLEVFKGWRKEWFGV